MATPRQLTAFALLQAEGYSPEGSAAWIGNFSQECGVNLPSGYRVKTDHGSQGVAQWRLGRLDAFQDWCETQKPPLHTGALASQLKYVAIEAARDYPTLDAALRKSGEIAALTARVCWEFERPSKSAANVANRIRQAQAVFATGEHVAVRNPATKARVAAAKAQASVVQHNSNAGLGVVLGGLIGGLHWLGGMPHDMAWTAGAVVGAIVLYSLANAKSATVDVLTASHAASAAASATPAPTSLPKAAPMLPVAIPAKPQGDAEWVFDTHLGWYMGQPPNAIVPAPVIVAHQPAPPPPASVTLTLSDLASFAKLVSAEISKSVADELADIEKEKSA